MNCGRAVGVGALSIFIMAICGVLPRAIVAAGDNAPRVEWELAPTAVSCSPTSGFPEASVQVDYTVANNSRPHTFPPPDFYVGVWFSDDASCATSADNTYLGQGLISGLESQTTISDSLDVTLPASATVGDATICVVVDHTEVVGETDETNNTMSAAFTVFGWELAPTALSCSPTSGIPDSSVQIDYTVTNTSATGTPPPADFWIGFWHSDDNDCATMSDNTHIGQTLVSGLGSQTSTSGSESALIPAHAQEGSGVICVRSDSTNVIDELDETNNTMSTAFTVISPRISWGFEPDEGFSIGWIDGQEGWQASTGASSQPQVDDGWSLHGTQFLRIGPSDFGFSEGDWMGAFSPVIPDAQSDESVAIVWLEWSSLSQGNFNLVLQAPSQGLVTAWIGYSSTGSIYVMTHNGATWQSHDTGCSWEADDYKLIMVDVDPQANRIVYEIGSCTHESEVFAGTVVEQIVLRHDSNPFAMAYVDSLQIYFGEAGAGGALIFHNGFETGGAHAWGGGLLFRPTSTEFYP